jgi:hypothetical protein
VRVRRATIIMHRRRAPMPSIARLVAAHEDTVRDVIQPFEQIRLRALTRQWAGRRPHRIDHHGEAFIVATATTRPSQLGARSPVEACVNSPTTSRSTPAGGWSSAGNGCAPTRTAGRGPTRGKESKDPDFDVKLDRTEQVTREFPQRCFTFDRFVPLSIRPHYAPGGRRAEIRTGCPAP